MGEVAEDSGGDAAGEGDGGEVELDDLAVLALDAGPVAGALVGGVPEEGSATHRGPQSQQCRSLRFQICLSQWNRQQQQQQG